MTKIHILLILIIPFILFGCKKKLTNFNLDDNFQTTIPSSSPVDIPFTIHTQEQETNSEAEFESHDTRKDKIQQIVLKDLVITILAPEGEDFSFLSSLEIYLSSTNHAEEKVAFANDISNDIGSEIVCNSVGQDLQKFVKDDKFKIRIRTVTDEVITQDIDINIYTNFFVDAKLIN
ncbi:MAG: hypothetical protein COA32_06325 [Fluviicola sp.]|nr:MAG: hypothetical protein COA32_06325 [Fluviicola sp.]